MALFIGWWSLANVLTGMVGSLRSLAAARFMLGAGESGLYVVAPKVVSQLFAPAERGLAVGILQCRRDAGRDGRPAADRVRRHLDMVGAPRSSSAVCWALSG
jgi:hypothetical protein